MQPAQGSVIEAMITKLPDSDPIPTGSDSLSDKSVWQNTDSKRNDRVGDFTQGYDGGVTRLMAKV